MAHARTRRLFVALAPPRELTERIASDVGATLGNADSAAFRFVRAAEMHVTLCFLGDFPDERRPALESALAQELRGLHAPELRIRRAGTFPESGRPRVLWLGVEEAHGEGRLGAVHGRTVQAALSQGWKQPASERGRAFAPHVTVARARRGEPAPVDGRFADLELDARWLPVEVVLFESRLGEQDRYAPLATFPLAVQPD